MAELNNIEDVWPEESEVVVTVKSDTRKEGTYVSCRRGKFRTLDGQPGFYSYPKWEQEEMKQIAAVCYVLALGNDREL